MRDLAALFIRILANICPAAWSGRGARALVAESILVKRQLLILNRAHERATESTRFGSHRCRAVCAAHPPNSPGPFRDRHQTVNPVEFHMALIKRKYRILFSPRRRKKVRQVCDGGNVQGLLGQCALAIVAILGALATLNL
jgi:hypothetical protein